MEAGEDPFADEGLLEPAAKEWKNRIQQISSTRPLEGFEHWEVLSTGQTWVRLVAETVSRIRSVKFLKPSWRCSTAPGACWGVERVILRVLELTGRELLYPNSRKLAGKFSLVCRKMELVASAF